jgi:bifunctional ADP-heptose synthase (sugar kinase/adenylyltransferase)
VPVLLDAGGEDRPLSAALLARTDYLCPNESELERLTGLVTDTDAGALEAARALLAAPSGGPRAVLATLGDRGALLLPRGGAPLWQRATPLPGGGALVDATAAGDAFRAAFAVALTQGQPLRACLRFAAAAGALAASRIGAMPSLPTRAEAEAHLLAHPPPEDEDNDAPRSCAADAADAADAAPPAADVAADACPLLFASRLNSMKSRRELLGADAGAAGADGVLGWVARAWPASGALS